MGADLTITFGGFTSAGVKAENQDAFALWQPTSGAVRYKGIGFCVADGVSCSDHAQQASGTSVTHFLNDYYSTPDSWDVKTAAGRVLRIKPGIERTEHPPCSGLHIPGVGCAVVIVEKVGKR